ncbi:MAG: DUF3343 domain-containing protein [Treponema sp.]|nr:DUF3343 domain-containing protein [Treponema sp.]
MADIDRQTEVIITFRRTQDAIWGERRLLDADIDALIIPAPRGLIPVACGIALRLKAEDLERARLILGSAISGIQQGSPVFGRRPPF